MELCAQSDCHLAYTGMSQIQGLIAHQDLHRYEGGAMRLGLALLQDPGEVCVLRE